LRKTAGPTSYINQCDIFILNDLMALSYAYAAYVVLCMIILMYDNPFCNKLLLVCAVRSNHAYFCSVLSIGSKSYQLWNAKHGAGFIVRSYFKTISRFMFLFFKKRALKRIIKYVKQEKIQYQFHDAKQTGIHSRFLHLRLTLS